MTSSPARTVLVAFGLFILTNGPVFFVTDRLLGGDLGWEEPFTREVFIATALVAVATVVLDRHRVSGERLMRPSPVAALAVVGFTGWIVLSSLWSLAPELTRGRSILYVGLAAFAWIVADLDPRRFRLSLAVAAGAAVVASLVVIALVPRIGLDRNDDWQGIYTNRNSLAPVAGIAILAGLGILADPAIRRRSGAAVFAVLSVIAMAGSGSRTAWLALAVASGAALAVVLARIGYDRYGRRAIAAVGGIGMVGAAGTVVVVARMWGESTFAQRRTIWSLVWDRIGERPLHGHGWFAMWNVPEFISSDPLLGRGSAHGSFLEVWLGGGLVAVVPFLVIVALAVFGASRTAWRDPGAASWTWLALVLFLVIENLTESFVLWFSYNWVLLMAAALRSGVGPRRTHAARSRAPNEPVSV